MRRREIVGAISIVLVVAAGAWLLPKERVEAPPQASRPPAVRLMSWLRNETPCDARVVTNRRTLGAFEALTGRVNVSEGMGPFLRPEMLRDLLGTMDDIGRLYRNPSESSYVLDRYGIDYVIGITETGFGYPVGMPSANLYKLRRSELLQPVTAGKSYEIFEVVGSSGSSDDDEPRSWSPCLRGDVEPSEPFQN
jgi:hypothetical protein